MLVIYSLISTTYSDTIKYFNTIKLFCSIFWSILSDTIQPALTSFPTFYQGKSPNSGDPILSYS